ncbi:MAG: transglycosylase SLT domain-containing protein [Gammaproteobacteria bacterium SHHR-1]
MNRADLERIVAENARRYGIEPQTMFRIAEIESGFRPNAKNPNSSAGGLFQFIDRTAKGYGLTNRYDPAAASDAAARLARDNAAILRKRLGRDPTPGEMYLAHQQGAGGAAKLLANPNARAVDIVGAKAVRLNGGKPDMTAGQFSDLWVGKFNKGYKPGKQTSTAPAGEENSLAGLMAQRRAQTGKTLAERLDGPAAMPASPKDLGPQVAENTRKNPPGYGAGADWLDRQLGFDGSAGAPTRAAQLGQKLGLTQPKSTPIPTQGFNDQIGPIPAAQRPTKTATAKSPSGYKSPKGGSAVGGLIAGLASALMDKGGGHVPDMPMDTNDYQRTSAQRSQTYANNLDTMLQDRWRAAMTPEIRPYDEEYV